MGRVHLFNSEKLGWSGLDRGQKFLKKWVEDQKKYFNLGGVGMGPDYKTPIGVGGIGMIKCIFYKNDVRNYMHA